MRGLMLFAAVWISVSACAAFGAPPPVSQGDVEAVRSQIDGNPVTAYVIAGSFVTRLERAGLDNAAYFNKRTYTGAFHASWSWSMGAMVRELCDSAARRASGKSRWQWYALVVRTMAVIVNMPAPAEEVPVGSTGTSEPGWRTWIEALDPIAVGLQEMRRGFDVALAGPKLAPGRSEVRRAHERFVALRKNYRRCVHGFRAIVNQRRPVAPSRAMRAERAWSSSLQDSLAATRRAMEAVPNGG